MKIKGLSRSEFNRLMAIPEAREIYEAKILQLKMLFKDQLALNTPNGEQKGGVVRMPVRRGRSTPGESTRGSKTSGVTGPRIIDASGFMRRDEAEQVKMFLDYFDHHLAVRQSVLENFFLKILPYTAVDITPEAKSG